ncbi:MAG: type II toxin-antitoxin system RelE/ParE family toxin [Methylotenera sp.]|nr:type II toxin-antitoxin system RelE/ParE family toxin [Methylotenera sp.]
MTYEVLQTKRFGRQYKKLNANVVLDVDTAITEIAEAPSIGERSKMGSDTICAKLKNS